MTKTLEEAIGCWTVNRKYNSLEVHATSVLSTARACRRITLKGTPQKLVMELQLLRGRLESIIETTDDAIRRCIEIINTKELE